jgi:hypothetical protein
MKDMTLDNAVEIIIRDRVTKLDNGCWKVSSPSFRINGKQYSVVRLFLDVFRPNELPLFSRPEIGRTCGNSFCVNPEHLFYKSVWHRFWEKVDKENSEKYYDGTRCWEWKNAIDGGGYGVLMINHSPYTREKAHRFSWLIHNGVIPKDMYVLHACDNPPCVNPKHLFLGSNLINMQDKVRKERQSRLFGDKNGRCLMTKEKVIEMRKLYSTGKYSYRKLIKMFGISQTQVARILHKESWIWVSE